MADRRAGLALFERAVTIHREDCTLLVEAGRFEASAVEAMPETGSRHERTLAYGLGAAPVFDSFRRLIGQLAGLLILVQTSGRREVLDLPDLPIAEERWRQTGETLAALDAPGGLGTHKARLEAAWRHIGECLSSFRRYGEKGGGDAAIDRAAQEIGAAYRALKSASDEEAGLSMIDFRQACCSCMAPRANTVNSIS